MPIRAIAYSSQAVPGLSIDEIDVLVNSADDFNQQAGVTGVLLFDGSRFMQYLEGPEEGIDAVYTRILASRNHSEIVELGRGIVGGRRFPYWSMRLLPTVEMELRTVAKGDWNGFARNRNPQPKALTGVDRLARLVEPHLT